MPYQGSCWQRSRQLWYKCVAVVGLELDLRCAQSKALAELVHLKQHQYAVYRLLVEEKLGLSDVCDFLRFSYELDRL